MECIENSMELMYTDVGLHRVKATKNSIFGLVLVLFVCLFFLISPAVTESKHNDLISDQSVTMNWKKKEKKNPRDMVINLPVQED